MRPCQQYYFCIASRREAWFYANPMTQTDTESMATDPRAQALLLKIEAFLAARESAGVPMSENKFVQAMRYPTLIARLRAGAGVSYSVAQRTEKFIKDNAPKKRGRK